jgi:4-hydroxythreonine-4-phosphate dehydrogenase
LKPIAAVSLGCPCGIGPEVAVLAAMATGAALLVGEPWVVERAARVAGLDPRRFVAVDDPRDATRLGRRVGVHRPASVERLDPRDAPFGRPTAAAGRAQLAWVDAATDLTARGVACALVTGPVSKHAIAESGAGRAASRFRGHTEHLAALLGAREVVMAFWSEKLTVSLVTTHLALKRVPRAITPEAVCAAAFHTAGLVRRLGKKTPRIAVAALNPHAGEKGLFGDEETTRILPGIELAKRRLAKEGVPVRLSGPMGAETALRTAYAGAFDAVVTMYHDQATIPMKLIGFGDSVNVTLGLPIVRTSTDHGTGYDRAGRGLADPRGMRAALTLALRLGAPRGR